MKLQHIDARRIAIIKPSALGDIMHALPVATALRQRFPDARITWVVNRAYEPILRDHPDLDDTLAFDRHLPGHNLFSALRVQGRFALALKRRRFDLAIDLQGLLRTGLMTWATQARHRLGLASAREGATLFYSHVVDDRHVDHAVDRYWQVVTALGAYEAEKRFRLALDPVASLWAEHLLEQFPRPWLALGMGARWQTKRWPVAHFAELAERARRTFGGSAFLVGARDEATLATAAMRNMEDPVNLVGGTSLPQLAALLARVDVLLANDSGPLHLAVALGRPVVAPYTCTKVVRCGPYGQETRAVATTVPCAGSYVKTCDRLDCMQELTPERLWPPLHEILRSWQLQTGSQTGPSQTGSSSPVVPRHGASSSSGSATGSKSPPPTSTSPPAPASPIRATMSTASPG